MFGGKSGGGTDFYVTSSGNAVRATGYRHMDSGRANKSLQGRIQEYPFP